MTFAAVTFLLLFVFSSSFANAVYSETCRKLKRPHVRAADFRITRKLRQNLTSSEIFGNRQILLADKRSATIHLLSSSLGEPSVASDCLKNFHEMYCDFPYLKLLLTRRKGKAVHRRTILDGVVAEFLGEIPEGKRIRDRVKRETVTPKCKYLIGFRFTISRLSIIRLLSRTSNKIASHIDDCSCSDSCGNKYNNNALRYKIFMQLLYNLLLL